MADEQGAIPEVRALIGRLRQGRLIAAATKIHIEGFGEVSTGETREVAHPDAHAAADMIERLIAIQPATPAADRLTDTGEGAAYWQGYDDGKRAALATPKPPVDAGVMRDALEWYAEQAAGCRKIGSAGDPFRHALDADGGKRALAAIRNLSDAGEAL